ncbi:hypothetical protein FGF04_09850 [Streptomyces apricus]|uniref:Uncharacterized protein n=1 Tax=Streptomyces apricus TaxID=1828112 RepID=A0A5B0BE33_9ACTN|nr:hypothetical protein FGF04_09850 [Streptomyces apricus]
MRDRRRLQPRRQGRDHPVPLRGDGHAERQLAVRLTSAGAPPTRTPDRMRLPGVRVEAPPSSVPDPAPPAADGTAKVVAAAGRPARRVPGESARGSTGSDDDTPRHHMAVPRVVSA